MINFEIDRVKAFMHSLLKTKTFDKFNIKSVEIITFAKFSIAPKEITSWDRLKPYVLNIVKGKTLPSMKIVFSLNKESILKENTDFFLNLYFSENRLSFTTGTASREFTLDKSASQVWEDYVKDFFVKNAFVEKDFFEEV